MTCHTIPKNLGQFLKCSSVQHLKFHEIPTKLDGSNQRISKKVRKLIQRFVYKKGSETLEKMGLSQRKTSKQQRYKTKRENEEEENEKKKNNNNNKQRYPNNEKKNKREKKTDTL